VAALGGNRVNGPLRNLPLAMAAAVFFDHAPLID
jgi:hypothetical protein